MATAIGNLVAQGRFRSSLVPLGRLRDGVGPV